MQVGLAGYKTCEPQRNKHHVREDDLFPYFLVEGVEEGPVILRRIAAAPGDSQVDERRTKHQREDDVRVEEGSGGDEVKEGVGYSIVVLQTAARVEQGFLKHCHGSKKQGETAERRPNERDDSVRLEEVNADLVTNDGGYHVTQVSGGQHNADVIRGLGDPVKGIPLKVAENYPSFQGHEKESYHQ